MEEPDFSSEVDEPKLIAEQPFQELLDQNSDDFISQDTFKIEYQKYIDFVTSRLVDVK